MSTREEYVRARSSENLRRGFLALPARKKLPGEGIKLQKLLHQHRKPIYTFPHISWPHRQVYAHAGRHRDHERGSSSAATRRASPIGSNPLFNAHDVSVPERNLNRASPLWAPRRPGHCWCWQWWHRLDADRRKQPLPRCASLFQA